MTNARFQQLVERMERLSKDRPDAYKRTVFALAALGYGYLALLLALLVGLCLAAAASVLYLKAFGVKLLIAIGGLLVIVARALWVRLTPPQDPVVARQQAPALFAMLDRLRERLRTPRFHEVQVTSDFNAAVTQVPLLGLFGWHRNYLMLGLPLMKALTIEQFEAVLAHELGHLSRGHARAGNWIYRLRLMWARLEAALRESEHWGSALVMPFYRWYVPYFQACSFPLARANEYEADAASVQLTSRRSAAQALTAVNVAGSFLAQRYWPSIHAEARDVAEPRASPYASFGPAAIASAPEQDTRTWLEAALARETTLDDTHPSLADRLNAVGATAEINVPEPGQAADQLLGAVRASLEEAFDDNWRRQIADSWREFHDDTLKGRARLAELRGRSADSGIGESELLDLAGLEETLGAGADAALALRRLAVARFAESVPARFALGRQLVIGGDPEGVGLLEDAIEREPEAILPGCQLLRDFHWARGDKEHATQWHARYVQRATELEEARAERDVVMIKDVWLSHGLDAPVLAALVDRLGKIPGLRRAYLVRKVVRHFPEQPLYVFGFCVTPWYRLTDKATGERVMSELREQVDWPGETFLLNVEGDNLRFGRKLRRNAGSRIL